MQTFYFTDPGKVRDHNEDNVIILNNTNNEFVLAVADGMGGHKAGEIASKIAIDTITNNFESIESLGKKEDAIEWIRNTVQDINHKIFEYTDKNQESKGMGTSLVIAIKTDDYILYGNIGDSSGFVIKNEQLHKVTKDHTLVNLLVSTGELTEEEAKYHPRKNVLMRALGANNPIDIDIFDVDTSVKGLFSGLITVLPTMFFQWSPSTLLARRGKFPGSNQCSLGGMSKVTSSLVPSNSVLQIISNASL